MALERDVAGIVDVAAKAGVSVSTVSRVLSGRTPVSDDLRRRVEDAVAELSYRPNAAAQSLVSGRRSTIAVFARNTIRYGYAATLQGIEEAARAAGYVVMIAVVESDDPRDIKRAVGGVLAQPLAGAIVIEFDQVGVATLEALPRTLPIIAAAGAKRPRSIVPHAFLDDHAGGYEATRYLLSLGHKTVHHLAIPATRARSGRAWGWRQALREAGAHVPPVVQADYSPTSGYDAARRLMKHSDVTAILCGNDELAIGASRAYQENGRRIPEDISIIGFDDQPFAQMWRPALTTVSQDFRQLGRRTVNMLQGWLDSGKRPTDEAILPELVERDSARGASPRTDNAADTAPHAANI